MAKYVVELYLARRSTGLSDVAARARAGAEQVSGQGTEVRFLRSIFIPEDETCFFVYEAASAEAVAEASREAALPYLRIVEASVVPPTDVDSR